MFGEVYSLVYRSAGCNVHFHAGRLRTTSRMCTALNSAKTVPVSFGHTKVSGTGKGVGQNNIVGISMTLEPVIQEGLAANTAE